MRVDGESVAIGVTFFSGYPQTASYYRLRRFLQPTRPDRLAFYMANHGPAHNGGPCATATTSFVPAADEWVNFRIRVRDARDATEIKVRLWEEGGPEPVGWMVDCRDTDPLRPRKGTVGLWAHDDGTRYWRNLQVVSLP